MGGNTSNSGAKNFYGGMTYGLPNRLYRNFVNPLIQGFGYGDRANNFRQGLGPGQGPLADYLQQVGGFTGSILPQSFQIGQNIAQQAPQLYGDLQNQIHGALGTLPELQQGAGDISSKAKFLVDQAFSPITSRALFQETMNRALPQARQAQAARGLLEQGTGQQQEQDLGQNLAYQFALNDQANQQNALGGYGQALQNQLGFNTAGIPIAGQGLDALNQLFSIQGNALNLPMMTAGNLFQLLSGGLSPGMQLSSITGPQQSSHAKGWNA